jgi:valyl-tRNA synthetase
VSTTRPETILGDTAVAVHPDDERYTHVVGKTALVPMLNREIPVIADAYVDMAFGTGALKVTPGHDPNDYEIGKQHGLPMINIMNNDATLNANAGPYAGLDRFECAQALWADMQEAGLVVSEEHLHQVGHCQRCGTIVEPLLSEQWWVKMQPLAEPALAAVANGDIQIVPQRFEKRLQPLAGEHPRLVHQPPTLVGPSHPCLVRAGRRRLCGAQRSRGAGQIRPRTTARK